MNAPSVDVVDMLESESSLGLADETNLFAGKEPSTPSNVVTIFDTTSIPPQLGLTTQGYEYPSVQIRVRNEKYKTGYDLMESIKEVLHGRHQETWNGTLYTVIYCASGPTLLDYDNNSRARFIMNINMQRREI